MKLEKLINTFSFSPPFYLLSPSTIWQVCYAFLQTKQNYHIVHSIWHMLMALSILCLLPKRKVFEAKC
jgi:ABC-type nitrate/sulfonate/bicarbonate transport system permease component